MMGSRIVFRSGLLCRSLAKSFLLAGLVEFCQVVGATYHRRILPEDTVIFTAGGDSAAQPHQPGREQQHEAALTAGGLQSISRGTSSSAEGGSMLVQPPQTPALAAQACFSIKLSRP